MDGLRSSIFFRKYLVSIFYKDFCQELLLRFVFKKENRCKDNEF